MTRMFTRQTQVGIKLEGTEGVEETLVAADYHLTLLDTMPYDLDTQTTDRNVQRASLSRDKAIMGHRGLSVTGKIELSGGTLAAPPVWHRLIRTSGYSVGDVDFITIGAVTNGPFRTGQLIGNHLTLGSATATGRVLMEHYDGTTRRLFYIPIVGTFGSSGTVANYETSQGSATISAGPADGGFYFKPQSEVAGTIPPSGTAHFRDGKQLFKAVGARTSCSLMFAVGETPSMEVNLQGPLALDLTRDPPGPFLANFLSGVSSPVAPPAILSVKMAMRYEGGAYFTPVLPQVGIPLESTLVTRPCITDRAIADSGRMPTLINGRNIGIQIEPETDVDAFDYIQNHYASNVFELGVTAGSPALASGAIGCWIPEGQTDGNMAPGDRDGIRTNAPSIRATGDNEDEIYLFHLMIA